jgi:hypothetical protein
MTKTQLQMLLDLANDEGIEAAYEQLQFSQLDTYEAACEAMDMERDECRDGRYVAGCGEYDTVDSKGRPLLSRRNEAGEYRW